MDLIFSCKFHLLNTSFSHSPVMPPLVIYHRMLNIKCVNEYSCHLPAFKKDVCSVSSLCVNFRISADGLYQIKKTPLCFIF